MKGKSADVLNGAPAPTHSKAALALTVSSVAPAPPPYGGDKDDELSAARTTTSSSAENGMLDNLDEGLGADILDGGGGTCVTADYRARVNTITVNLASAGSAQGEAGEGDTIVNI